MTPGTDGKGAGKGMLELQTKVNGGEVQQMIWPKVSCESLVMIILVSREGFGEMGKRTPFKLAGLIDAGLLQYLLDQTAGLVWLVVIMAGEDDRGDAGPGIRAVGVKAGDLIGFGSPPFDPDKGGWIWTMGPVSRFKLLT